MRAKRYFDALSYYSAFFRFKPYLLLKKGVNILQFVTSPRKDYCHNLPLTAQIEPTLRCNLKCTMCVREHFSQGDMKLDDFKRTIDQLDCLVKIHLQGLGEPFLHPHIFEMIDYANSKNIMVSVITNGTLFSDRIVERVAKSDIFEIGVSIDSVEKKSYEAIRVGADFDRVLSGVKKLSKALRGKNTSLFLAVTIMRSNMHMIPDFVRLAHSVGVKRVVFQRVQTKDDFVSYYKSDFRKSKEFVAHDEVKAVFNRAKPVAESLGVKILFEEEVVRCQWPWRGVYITWNGDITPCCMIVDPKSMPLGNVFRTPLKLLWNSPAYRALRRSLLRRKPLPACAGCRAI